MRFLFFFPLLLILAACRLPEKYPGISYSEAGYGWSRNSVNTVVFRKNSLTSFNDTQYIAYYDSAQYVVLGKRTLPAGEWEIRRTSYRGDAYDAHNSISIMVDGQGFLHMAWGHHNDPLQYVRSVEPASLVMSDPISMTGEHEDRISYPEFYRFPDGDLFFLYRDGASGNGNLVINRYDVQTQIWYQVQDRLINGEGRRNAYWQACIDERGAFHLSWVWRESPDVASNHDLCYARTEDKGKTWNNSVGKKYQLPITRTSAEYAQHIPEGSELINQTSMCADKSGSPVIASYWRAAGDSIPQYHLVFKTGKGWETEKIRILRHAFSLSGGGTKQIPIARPQVFLWMNGPSRRIGLLFRAEERKNTLSLTFKERGEDSWEVLDIDTADLGSWEPSFDTNLWEAGKIMSVYVQRSVQADGEGMTDLPPQPVRVISFAPARLKNRKEPNKQ